MPYFSNDDIAQICTPPGAAATGAVRISGDNAFAILLLTAAGLEPVLGGIPKRGVHDCSVRLELSVWGAGGPAPRVRNCPARAYIMPAPASYTRENVAELHLPGSPPVIKATLAALVRAGARPAAPGEFTFRAFRNGRISLGQAEAVEELVRSGDAANRRAALNRLGGRGRERVEAWRERVMRLAAGLEAALDFPDVEPLADAAKELAALAAELAGEGAALSMTSPAELAELPHIALAGLTNAGKSSLMNALVGNDEVLVSPLASTTRDSVRREVEWHGARFTLSDNPGYDPDADGSGGRAADRAFRRLGGEDLVCWVVDRSRPLDAAAAAFASGLPERVVLVLNKSDMPPSVAEADVRKLAAGAGITIIDAVETSALRGEGSEALRRLLADAARGLSPARAWSRREMDELSFALDGCRAAAAELAGAGRCELAADDVRRAAEAFSRALGEDYSGEALTRIFSTFCIGK